MSSYVAFCTIRVFYPVIGIKVLYFPSQINLGRSSWICCFHTRGNYASSTKRSCLKFVRAFGIYILYFPSHIYLGMSNWICCFHTCGNYASSTRRSRL